jgi:uncharacterized membrane protein YeiH
MDVVFALDLFGTAVFAATGALRGVEKGLDLFGIVVVALLTAIGGGTIRDLLLDVEPFYFRDPQYLLVALAAVPVVLVLRQSAGRAATLLVVLDAIGLGVFSGIGASKGLDLDVGLAGALITGVLTGIGGGIVRDLLVQEIPFVLVKDIYATASAIGILVLLALREGAGADATVAILACTFVVATIRIVTHALGFHLPAFRVREDPPPPG